MGVGTAFSYSALPNLVIGSVPAENTSKANRCEHRHRTVFQAISTSIAAMLLASSTATGTAFSTETGYFRVFALIGIGAVAAFVIAHFIKPGHDQLIAKAERFDIASPTNAEH